jgi:glucose/arabinose dehydrogenase
MLVLMPKTPLALSTASAAQALFALWVVAAPVGCASTDSFAHGTDASPGLGAGDAQPPPADATITADTSVAVDATTAGDDAPGTEAAAADASDDSNTLWPVSDAAIANPCALPGSEYDMAGTHVVVGARPAGAPDLSFVHLPQGFCVHYFATVGKSVGGSVGGNVRQLRFAPGGELFVASPTTGTTGGNSAGGLAAIVIVPDDNHDGLGDSQVTFLANLPSTQGLMFANGQFYYQNGTAIMAMPYQPGQRAPSGAATQIANITLYTSALHWPKTFDIADDGTIYAGNGGDQDEACDPTRPFHGGILKLDTPGGTPVAKGLRNPIAVRCWHGHGSCFALELAKDYSAGANGREKMLPIRSGDDWGFPCCASQGLPYTDVIPTPDCSAIAVDTDSWLIGDTPFGLDFETGVWPAPWQNVAIIATHGAAGSWTGARVVAIPMDTTTGLAMAGTDVNGSDMGAMVDFATGWDDGTHAHGRPASVAFSNDGRLFLGNDTNGIIVWIAPLGM